MKQVFVDTSAWDAIADAGDAKHEIALLYKEEIAENCRLVVTNYIFDELHTLMLMNHGYQVDKEWSFTDCVSYVVMKQCEITDVFTFDHHFTQMGFVKQP